MSAHLRPYPAYGESDVSWLGAIPSHWERAHGGAVLQQKYVKNRGMMESTVLSLSYGRIVIKPPEKLHGLVPESFETYQVVDPGDIIVRPTDLQNDWNTIRMGIARDRGIITSAYLCFRAREPLTADYAHLLLLGYDLKKVFYGMGSGLRQNLDWSDFKRLPVLVPPPDEQDAIVRFVRNLDKKINQFIRNRRRLIEVLNEQKQAIINRAVTRGLDPNVPLKPSGIDWLGDIPTHWEATTLGRIVSAFKTGPFGSILHQSDYIPGGVPLVNPIHMSGGRIIPDLNCAVDDVTFHRLREYALIEGDVVFSRRGELGRCALVRGEQSGWLTGTGSIRARLIPNAVNQDFLIVALQGQWVTDYLSLMSVGATMQSLNTGILSRLPLPLPPAKEQAEIPVFIERESARVNKTIEKTQREIDLIREYRTRLIADVVAGKVDVRHLAPAPGDEPVEPEELPEAIEDDEIQADDEPELVEEAGES